MATGLEENWTTDSLYKQGFEDASEGLGLDSERALGLDPYNDIDNYFYDYYVKGYKDGERYSF